MDSRPVRAMHDRKSPGGAGAEAKTMHIALSRPELTQDDIDAVVAVLRTPQLSLGPKLSEFEQAFAEYVGTEHAVAVSSGTAGLHLCMCALKIKPGDEVLTTPFSFVASANCALMAAAKPVFVDIHPETWNIDVHALKCALTDRSRVMLPVHVFGEPADMDVIRDLAAEQGLLVVEDACEALGSTYKQQKIGTFGDAAVFGFYPNKQITTGEGGMVVTNQATLANMIRSLRNQGRDQMGGWLAHPRLGFNYRISDINCALGCSQLSRIEQFRQRREQVAEWYAEHLRGEERVVVQRSLPEAQACPFVMVIRLVDKYEQSDRDRIMRDLRARGIECSNYFAPIHLQPFYVERFGYKPGDFPICERIAARTIALPFHTQLQEEEVQQVCHALQALL